MTPPDDGSHLVFSNDTASHSRVSFYPPHSISDGTVPGLEATVLLRSCAVEAGTRFAEYAVGVYRQFGYTVPIRMARFLCSIFIGIGRDGAGLGAGIVHGNAV
jgi:hypothetical protein